MLKIDKVETTETVVVIGHPTGLPRKYTTSQPNFVSPSFAVGYFWTSPLDTFGGNSGSGVFSLVTGEMVGIAGGFYVTSVRYFCLRLKTGFIT